MATRKRKTRKRSCKNGKLKRPIKTKSGGKRRCKKRKTKSKRRRKNKRKYKMKSLKELASRRVADNLEGGFPARRFQVDQLNIPDETKREIIKQLNKDRELISDFYSPPPKWSSKSIFFIDKNSISYSMLKLDNKIIACHIGYIYKNTFFYIFPVYNESFKKFSPGNILFLKLIEYCKEKKFDYLDLTIGDENYNIKILLQQQYTSVTTNKSTSSS